MQLISPFSVSSFSRLIWISPAAKAAWSGAVRDIGALVSRLEVESVAAGHRPCAWQTIGEHSLADQSAWWGRLGLRHLVLKRVASFSGFSHRHEPPAPGAPASVCVAIGKSAESVFEFREAFERNDNVTQGVLLGFPRCCAEFFAEVWPKGYYDPIWQAAENTASVVHESEFVLRIDRPETLSNAALRYAGLRVGFHLPHSFDCAETVRIGEERVALGRSIAPGTMDALAQLLRMPMVWDCRAGTVVVRTPLFYIVSSSVPAAHRYVVKIGGLFLPDEGVWGETIAGSVADGPPRLL